MEIKKQMSQSGTATAGPVSRSSVRGAVSARPQEERLRIALCVDSLSVGGTELNAVRTAERLLGRGLEVILLVLRREGPLVERCAAAGIPVVEFPIPPLGSPRALLRGVALVRLLRRLRIDIVHTQDRYSNAFVVPWARLAGLRVLASRRWWDVHPSRALGWANRLAYRVAHGVVANSGRVAELVRRGDGVPAERVFVVPNFLDEAAVAEVTPGERRRLRSLLGVPMDALVVGVVANLRPVKDHRTLLDAVARITSDRPELVLCLVGDGELRQDLEEQAVRLGIASAVRFAGRRSEPVNWHAAFDISALTSLNEGFPNTVIEAMAAGRPVVATAVGGVPDAVRDGETGLLVEAGAVAPLARALERLLADAELRAAMGAAGREEALRRFQASVVVPEVESLYRSQATSGRKGWVRR